jgi:arylsulfatase A-like enzyme
MGGSNGPWRGHFASGFEGGMRAPAMVRWPGNVQAGVVTDEMFAAVDWLPTLAAMVGESDRVPGAVRSTESTPRRSCSGRRRRPDETMSSTSAPTHR